MNSSSPTAEILHSFLGIPSVEAAMVIGRDGFVIETLGRQQEMDLDALGASLARTIMRMEDMGKELHTAPLRDMFVEYEGNTILFKALKDSIVVVVARDASDLGAVRVEMRSVAPQLGNMH